MAESIRVTSVNGERAISAMLAPVLSDVLRDRDQSEAEVVAMALEALKSAIVTLAETPIVLEVNWPAGVSRDCRATIRAQLRAELEEVARRRTHQEFVAIIGTLPALGNAMRRWVEELARQAYAEASTR